MSPTTELLKMTADRDDRVRRKSKTQATGICCAVLTDGQAQVLDAVSDYLRSPISFWRVVLQGPFIDA